MDIMFSGGSGGGGGAAVANGTAAATALISSMVAEYHPFVRYAVMTWAQNSLLQAGLIVSVISWVFWRLSSVVLAAMRGLALAVASLFLRSIEIEATSPHATTIWRMMNERPLFAMTYKPYGSFHGHSTSAAKKILAPAPRNGVLWLGWRPLYVVWQSPQCPPSPSAASSQALPGTGVTAPKSPTPDALLYVLGAVSRTQLERVYEQITRYSDVFSVDTAGAADAPSMPALDFLENSPTKCVRFVDIMQELARLRVPWVKVSTRGGFDAVTKTILTDGRHLTGGAFFYASGIHYVSATICRHVFAHAVRFQWYFTNNYWPPYAKHSLAFLLHGPPGSGKSTMAPLIAAATGRYMEYMCVKKSEGVAGLWQLHLNAARSVVVFNEADNLLPTKFDGGEDSNTYNALCQVLEDTAMPGSIFVFTTNASPKCFGERFLRRCMVVEVGQPDAEVIAAITQVVFPEASVEQVNEVSVRAAQHGISVAEMTRALVEQKSLGQACCLIDFADIAARRVSHAAPLVAENEPDYVAMHVQQMLRDSRAKSA